MRSRLPTLISLGALVEIILLQEDTVLGAQVERMLANAKAADAIPSFHLQWLGLETLEGLDKDTRLFPSFNPALATAMRAETAAFTDDVVRKGDGLRRTLLQLYGGARGALPTGRFLDRNREPHAKLLVSICRLMGLSDVNGVGDINANSGPLAGIG